MPFRYRSLKLANVLHKDVCQLVCVLQNYGTAADVFSYGVVLWELLTLEQPWFNDHERPGLCSRVMPEVHGGNQLFVIRQVPLGVRLPLPSAQDVEPPLPDLPKVSSKSHRLLRYVLTPRP